jgi:lysozyme
MKTFILLAFVSVNCFADISPYLSFTEKWEGRRHEVYTCSTGHKTIGVGHKLKKGENFTRIDDGKIDYLFRQDMLQAINDAKKVFDNFDDLPHEVKLIVCDLSFNVGLSNLLKFKKTIAACEKRDFRTMALELKDSLWYKQTGNRAKNHVRTLKGLP